MYCNLFIYIAFSPTLRCLHDQIYGNTDPSSALGRVLHGIAQCSHTLIWMSLRVTKHNSSLISTTLPISTNST
jgi:hypothetical protein